MTRWTRLYSAVHVSLPAMLVMMLVGCSLAAAPASPSPQAEIERPKTAYGQLFARLSADGVADKQLALDAFATVIAPLPGINPPAGDPPLPHERVSGTFAIRWIMRHYDELTAEQKAAVDAALEPSGESIEVPTGEARSWPLAAVGLIAQPSAELQRYRNFLKEAELAIGAKLRRTLPPGAWVAWINPLGGEQGVFAATNPIPGGCSFKINSALRELTNETDVRVTLAHEMFHCFQIGLVGASYFAAGTSWIIEGQAEWVGEAIAGPGTAGLPFWEDYLRTPHFPLFGRAHSATGFYWHLAESSIDPWTRLDAMLNVRTDNDAAFRAAGAESEAFLNSWASGFLRDEGFKGAWYAQALWSTGARAIPTFGDVANGSSLPVAAPAVANDVYFVNSSADIVEIRMNGYSRLRLATSDLVNLDGVFLCTKVGGCKCPEGAEYKGPTLVEAPLSFFLAVSGSLAPTNGTLTGHPLDDFCEPDESPPPPDDCESGCPMSNGDPHIVTIGDDSYDFMAVGEFVLLRSADGSFELQARQEPYGESRSVSVNTALAMRVGTQRVGIYAVGETLEVRVDGSVVDPSGGPIPVGGGALTYVPGFFPGVEVTFADGTHLTAFGEFQYGINVTIRPSAALRAGAVGIMGPVPDGDALDIPALPDGTVLPDVFTNQEYEDALYGPFEEAWRVTSASSLFDYRPGASTENYIDESFPDRQALLSFDELTEEQRATGEAACVGITDMVLVQQCVYDVFVTGDTGFGKVYEVSLSIVETGALPQTGAQSRVVNLYSENGQPVDLDVYAYTWSETEMSEVAALVATVPYGQASDWFNPGLVVGNPFTGAPYTKVTLERHGEVADPINPLSGTMENLGPGTVSTLVVWQEVLFDEPAEHLMTMYSRHPDYEIPQAPPGGGLLITHDVGLRAENEPPLLYATVGDGCLEHPLADPSFPFPQPQPIGNHLMIPAGEHTLTLHATPPLGEQSGCDDEPVGPGVPVSVAPGGRFLLFPYRLPGATEINTLVVPFDSQP